VTGTQDVGRRVVIRGAVAFGLLGAAGVSLSACGDDSTDAAGAAPEAVTPTPQPARTIRPGGGKQPTSKSDLYQRGPEPRPARTAAPAAPEATPEPTPVAVASGEPTAGSRSDDNLATARQRDTKGQGRPTASPTPAPLPPGAFARTSDIPVGGGRTFKDRKLVVTQPTAGQFKGFSATCTHAGCLVDKVEGGQIICPCHGSRFSIADGKVEKGPALLPLPAEKITVSSDGAISKG
jgi:Rieske Fe-S protein